jgi:hypothetical protein
MSSSESRLCSTMMKGFRLATFKQNAFTYSPLAKNKNKIREMSYLFFQVFGDA